MTYDIDHATCSARMRALVAGDLDDRTAAAVARHIESCHECSAEHRAVRLLLDDPAPLTSDERTALHAAVDARAAASVSRPSHRSWGRRLAPALAAAVVLVLVAVAAPFVLTGSDQEATDAFGQRAGGGSAAETAGGAAHVEKDEARSSTDGPLAGLRFDASGGDLTRAGLRRMGRRASAAGSTWVTIAGADPEWVAGKLTSRLARAAPAAVAEQVQECVDTVLSEGRTVPVHGAIGTLEGTEVVVVAFARATDRGTLGGYQVWAWPRGSCDTPVSFQAGRVP